jgi:RIO kinase 1
VDFGLGFFECANQFFLCSLTELPVMAIDPNALEAVHPLIDEGWVREILYEVKSGKEATVYCCRADDRCPAEHHPLLAAKVYRPIESRRFKNDAIYQTGRMHVAREGRVKRATDGKSAFGRKVQYGTWLENEWETMNLLFDAGIDIPRPIARSERAILMSYLGDEQAAAPKLIDTELERSHAAHIADRLLWNIEVMLHFDRVHGDLSPFNILYWNGVATIIDFPQAIDPRLNPAGFVLLSRDVDNICKWAGRSGVHRNAHAISQALWDRFTVGEIG